MNTKEDKFDLKQVLHYCTKCNEYMSFHTTEEVETEKSNLHFVVYVCPKCDEVIWILDRDNQYLTELSNLLSKKRF